MKIAQDQTFRDERERFALRFTCEDCALWDPANDRCAHGFPTREHRRTRYDDAHADVVFCKEFELT